MNVWTWSAVAVVPFLMACSGSSSDGGSAGGSGHSGLGGGGSGGTGMGGTGVGGTGAGTGDVCSDVCNKTGAASCPYQKPIAECISDCEAHLLKWQAQCASQLSSFVSCIAGNTVTCMVGGGVYFKGCESEVEAFGACTACIAESDDDACDTCSKSSCCTERKAVYDVNYYKCIANCADVSCASGCAEQSGLVAAAKALVNCENTKCASAGC